MSCTIARVAASKCDARTAPAREAAVWQAVDLLSRASGLLALDAARLTLAAGR